MECQQCQDRGITPVPMVMTSPDIPPFISWYDAMKDEWYTWGLCNCIKQKLERLEQALHGLGKRERSGKK